MNIEQAIAEINSHPKSQSLLVLAGRTLAQEVSRLTAEKPLIAAQMLALDQERERVEGENMKLREALAQAGWALKLAINGRPVRDADEIFCRIDTINRAALKE